MKNIYIIVGVVVAMLWVFGSLMDSALADNDVTSSGSTTNDQVNSTGSNTAITGGYNSETENTTNYQSGSSSNTTSTSTTNNNSYTGDTRVVPSASAPSISAMSQDLWVVGVSGGIQKFGLGASIGGTKRDMNCERMKLSKLLFDYSMKVAAVAILCQDPRVFEAMANSQTFCPINGKIGNEAEEEWKKYGKLRPDYEEYVKALRYMEKVDAEIMEELDDKESYITDGNGNAVQLGGQK